MAPRRLQVAQVARVQDVEDAVREDDAAARGARRRGRSVVEAGGVEQPISAVTLVWSLNLMFPEKRQLWRGR